MLAGKALTSCPIRVNELPAPFTIRKGPIHVHDDKWPWIQGRILPVHKTMPESHSLDHSPSNPLVTGPVPSYTLSLWGIKILLNHLSSHRLSKVTPMVPAMTG